MSKLLSFLIRKEDESQFETSDAEFKGLVFANSPELYNQIFKDEMAQVDDMEFIEMQPDNVDELQAMVDDMKRMGAF